MCHTAETRCSSLSAHMHFQFNDPRTTVLAGSLCYVALWMYTEQHNSHRHQRSLLQSMRIRTLTALPHWRSHTLKCVCAIGRGVEYYVLYEHSEILLKLDCFFNVLVNSCRYCCYVALKRQDPCTL